MGDLREENRLAGRLPHIWVSSLVLFLREKGEKHKGARRLPLRSLPDLAAYPARTTGDLEVIPLQGYDHRQKQELREKRRKDVIRRPLLDD